MRLGGLNTISFILSALLLATVTEVLADDIEDSQTIGLYSDEVPAVATSPIPRPVSRIAENVTVITADDILRLNAHTLADVLQTVPGIQLDTAQRSPGTITFFNVQGALNSTVLVLVDGIRQNDFDQDVAWPSLIPVQQIDRIEIIKGAASGSWGSALGGVVNIVTRSPDTEGPASGMVSSSIGSRSTSDTRLEASGTAKRFGYYFSAGRLSSDGLSPNTGITTENQYAKFSYTLPGDGTATAGVFHLSSSSGEGEGITSRGFIRQDGENEHTYGFVNVHQPLRNDLSFDIQGYGSGRDDGLENLRRNGRGDLFAVGDFHLKDSTRGINASLSWGDSSRNLVAGGEYLHGHGTSRDVLTQAPAFYDRTWDSFAVYLNGTCTVGPLSVLPGVRFDSTGFSGDHTSYSLGLTYQLAEHTTMRAYAAEGFSLPMLVADTGTQRVRTAQAGVESSAVPFLWLKATYFFNDLRNVESAGPAEMARATDQHRQGFELEGRTTPVYGIFLAAGYTFLHAEDETTGHRLQSNAQQSVPPQVYKLAVNYGNPALGLNTALTGSGVVWNAPTGYPARAKGMIWDLNLIWKTGVQHAFMPELFFSAHNLFDGLQTTNTWLSPTATRWYEGGARFRF